ncbi:MAG: hypothetical protein ACOY7T_09830 [Pseudomonadota bacterium]
MTLIVPNFLDFPAMLAFREEIRSRSEAELDFSQIGFAYPDGMVMLARIISDRIEEGAALRAINYENQSYPINMGFFEACRLDIESHPNAPGNANYFPIRRYSRKDIIRQAEEFKQHPGEVIQSLSRQLSTILIRGKNADIEETISYSMREIIRNIIEHSGSEEFLISGQYYPSKGIVEIAMMDKGVGVREGLSSNPLLSISDDYEAISKSLIPGISGKNYRGMEPIAKSEWNNSGFGLYMTSQICRMGGRFNIGSGSTLLSLLPNYKEVHQFGFQGTFIGMEIRVAELPRLIGLTTRLARRGEALAKLIKVQADVEASYASKFIMED